MTNALVNGKRRNNKLYMQFERHGKELSIAGYNVYHVYLWSGGIEYTIPDELIQKTDSKTLVVQIPKELKHLRHFEIDVRLSQPMADLSMYAMGEI